jgi:Protein of unknown function (DUF4043)
MAETILATASERQVWQTKYFQEYVRHSRFAPYMSNADINKGGIILTKFQHETENFRTINVPFIGRLKSSGVTGASVLDGVEEELTNYNCPITIDWRRNGVRLPKSTTFRTEVNLWDAARDALRVWESEKLRDDIIKALAMAIVDQAGTIAYWDQASATQQNQWLTYNPDRVLYGYLNSNQVAGNHAGSMATVNSTMVCTASQMQLAKRIAKLADPHIRPYRVEDGDGREYFVAFHGARTFRDLKRDNTIITADTQARAREGMGMEKNPLFQDGDLIYDGVIHREIPEIDAYCAQSNAGGGTMFNGAGSGGCDIRPVFVCGGGALGIAWGQEPTPRTDMIKDYGFRPGVAIEELLGVKKINFNGVQNGIVTVFTAAAADS